MKKNVLLRTNILICIIIIMGFTITSLISYYSNHGIYKQDTEYISTLTSEGIYHQIDSIFTKPIHISMTMANDSLLKNFLAEEENRANDEVFIQTMRDYLYAYKEKYGYDSVFLVSAKTNRYYHFDKGVDRVLTAGNPENQWYYSFLKAPEEYSLNIDNDEVTAANNEITVFINCKIRKPNGEVMGVVGVGFRVGYLQGMLKEYEENFGIKAYLVDKNGVIEISTTKTRYENVNMLEPFASGQREEYSLSQENPNQSFWYASGSQKGFFVTRYIQNLDWHLIIEKDTFAMERELNRQLSMGVLVIIAVIIAVLIVITGIIRKYNAQIVKLTLEQEKKHQLVFKTETEKIYESIYEIDVTHKRAASEATEDYFESLGVPRNTPYDKALLIISNKQIKEEYRKGYMATFSSENVLKAYADGIENLHYDFMISGDNGRTYYWMRITARIFYWDDDKSVRMFIYRENIDAQKQQEKRMIAMMERDSLTGLYNKATTQKMIQRLLKGNPGNAFAFFIIDIDNFKTVNDTCGHAFGDMTITDFSLVLTRCFQSDDIVGRIGGDEFVAFVAVPSRIWVEQKAQELLGALRHEVTDGAKRYNISASIGIALAPESGCDFETLYKNADVALYYRKKYGKDGYAIFSDL